MEVQVELAIFTLSSNSLQVLLRASLQSIDGSSWSLPSKTLEEGESLDQAIAEVLGSIFNNGKQFYHVEQLETYQIAEDRSSQTVVRVAYLLLAQNASQYLKDDGSSKFIATALVSSDKLRMASREILIHAIERIRERFEYTPIALVFVDEPFTMRELRMIYEAVWGIPLHPANFRRHVMSIPGFVKPLTEGRRVEQPAARTTTLYLKGGATILQPALLKPVGEINRDLTAPSFSSQELTP